MLPMTCLTPSAARDVRLSFLSVALQTPPSPRQILSAKRWLLLETALDAPQDARKLFVGQKIFRNHDQAVADSTSIQPHP
jgi:hypothetical protein